MSVRVILAVLLFQVVRSLYDLVPYPAPSIAPVRNEMVMVDRTTMSVPGISRDRLSPMQLFSVGGTAVDANRALYILADRTARSVDIFDMRRKALVRQIFSGPCENCRFTGLDSSLDPTRSGPNGIVLVPGTSRAWIGDVGSVKLVDLIAGTIVRSSDILSEGMPSPYRSDFACIDAPDNLVMFANPDDPTPFATWINASSGRIVARVSFPTSIGLRDCIYWADTKSFYIENTGSARHQTGEIDVFSASSIRLGRAVRTATYDAPECAPRGLARDRRGRIMIGCDSIPTVTPDYGLSEHHLPLHLEIVDLRDGRTIRLVDRVGGVSSVAFDTIERRWYVAAPRMTANGLASGPPTPVLGVIDARRDVWLGNVPIDPTAQTISVDPSTSQLYMPIQQTSASDGGVSVFSIRTKMPVKVPRR